MKNRNEHLSPERTEETARMDAALRPLSLREFIGQERLKKNLRIFIDAARKRKEPLDHCLLYSPPGLGKTTLSHIIARELGVNIKMTSGPVLSKPGDLATILTTEINEGDVLFIDEIHRLNAAVEEALYPAMEDFIFFVNTGKGPGSTTLKLPVPKFTLVAATTRSGLLTGPLKDRFGIMFNLNFYSEPEIETIIRRSADILNVKASAGGVTEIARRSRGTPRIANRLLKRVRDFAEVTGKGEINAEITLKAMESLGIDECGLDDLDKRLLKTIILKFAGGPVGLETLAIALNEEPDTLTESIEPFLMQSGFMERTPRGRKATLKAYEHLGIKRKKEDLF